jgi:alpha-ketoglutarate-dependent 2,4-dichlorophenoxyacetate dioxygenase
MTRFDLTPLNPLFGVEVRGLDLMDVTGDTLFPELRALFEEHSALLFRAQDLSPEKHIELATLFGPIEDRQADERKPGEAFVPSPRFRTCWRTARQAERWTSRR